MRKFLIPIAAAASALAIAAPASAQFYGSPGYGYSGYGYNAYNGYGYNGYRGGYDNYRGGYDSGRLVALNRQRMARIHIEIDSLARSGAIGPGEAASLNQQASRFDQELNWLSRGGLSGNEAARFDAEVASLGQQIRARSGYGYGYSYGYDSGNGYGGYAGGYGDGYAGYNGW